MYVRFLTAADDVMETAIQVGLKRTGVHTSEEAQQHWRDLSAVRAKLYPLRTELRLVVDQPVYERAEALFAYLFDFGEEALNASGGMALGP
jgi:hypothetical protein